ncbi:MAG: polar amino acid transport system substrate-binding protein [Psychromonas sp.]|jgi:polar amino acid transport system substrate-binding protein|uniref:substrate-binding periplasmic protein n=1 Tax=Psychromonas sp. TaxID=1884585 RepID=UPI0039E7227C
MAHKFSKIGYLHLMLLLLLPRVSWAENDSNIRWTTERWPKVAEEGGVGAYFDLLNAVYPAPEFQLVHSFLPYKRGILFVREGRLDLFSLCTPTTDFYKAKHPWAQESIGVLFNNAVITEWHGLATLKNKNIALHKEIAFFPFLQRLDANLIKADSKAKSLLLLEKERVDFFLDIYINIQNELKQRGDLDISRYTFEPLDIVTCYPGFSPSPRGQKLRELWDKGIENLHKSGKLKKIYEKWQLEYPNYQWQE